MRIVFVAPLWYGSTSSQRLLALRDLGNDVFTIDTSIHSSSTFKWLKVLILLINKIFMRLHIPLDLAKANATLLEEIKKQSYSIVLIEKGLTIKPSTLLIIKTHHPECRLLSYSPDDMSMKSNQSHSYVKSIPLYDLHVTNKSYNVSELKLLGAREVLFLPKAYDPHLHYPRSLTTDEISRFSTDVSFIGAYEADRYNTMLFLAKAGIKVTIRGPGWETYINKDPNLNVIPGWIYPEDYVKIICSAKINLAFLRKSARDLQTDRSVEIPACGAFMIAERTSEHLQLFQENVEAVFFNKPLELHEKVLFYLENAAPRNQVAHNGRERCINSGYSITEQFKKIFEYLSNQQ
jgi:dsDNA-binding SOS-regulon protein